MAIGLAQMMGFTIPENFNNPYTSSSITGFWRTWHISLGKWMRNYLYIPLGGNRSSKYRLYLNLTLVFLASGLWHGAQWTFIIWGLYHGTFLVLERAVYGKQLEKISKWISVPITFIIVVIGWVFFKSENVDKALQYIDALFHFSNNTTFIEFNLNQLYYTLAAAIVFSFFVLYKPFEKIQNKVYFADLNSWQTVVFTLASISLFVLCVAYVAASDFNPFIYFRF
jgi:alginate O-acetyltransferase complex protein AlgI